MDQTTFRWMQGYTGMNGVNGMGGSVTRNECMRLTWFGITAGLLLLLAGIFLGQALAQKLVDLGGDYGAGMISANIRTELHPGQRSFFSLRDVEMLSRNANTAAIACQSRIVTRVGSGYQSTTASVNGVNYLYPQFHRLELKSGSFFTAKSQSGFEAVAVIDAGLAVKLFNTEEAMGAYVTIFNRKFKIIGVLAPERSIVSTVTDSGIFNIYIPINVLVESSPETRISYLQMSTTDRGVTGKNTDDLVYALQTIGKNPADYKIIDYNIANNLLSQKPQLLLMLLSMLLILKLVYYLKNQWQTVFGVIREDCRNVYLSQALRFNKKPLIWFFGKVLLVSGSIFFLWRLAAFKLYIPPEYIPDELINFNYFAELFKSKMQTTITSAGYIPAPDEVILNKINMLSNLAFCGGLIGFLLLYFGCARVGRYWRRDENKLTRSVAYGGLLLAIVFLIIMVIGACLGLEVNPEPKRLLIIWIFIFISFVIQERREIPHNDYMTFEN